MVRSGLAILVLAAGLVAAVLLGGWRAWLAASVLAVSLPAGAIGWTLVMRLALGTWTGPLAQACAVMAARMPLASLMFAPVLFALPALYPWIHARPETAFRAAWLSPVFFSLRTIIWLAALSAAGWAIGAGRPISKAAASVGLMAFFVLQTALITDWLASLDRNFSSSGFGLYVMAIQFGSALALAIVAGSPSETHRAGALLLSLTLIWAYFAFMQYFILWSGNLPAGMAWYHARGQGAWPAVEGMIAACRLPVAAALLFRSVRHSRRWMILLAGTVLLGSMLEFAWLALPGSGANLLQGALYAVLVLAAAALCWPPRSAIPDEGGAA